MALLEKDSSPLCMNHEKKPKSSLVRIPNLGTKGFITLRTPFLSSAFGTGRPTNNSNVSLEISKSRLTAKAGQILKGFLGRHFHKTSEVSGYELR